MHRLDEIYVGLPRPSSIDSLSAQRIAPHSPLRVGKSSRGECGLLLELLPSDPVAHGIRLHLVEYQPSLDVRIEVDGKHQDGRFALLMCRSPDDELRRYFFRIAEGLASEITNTGFFRIFDHSVRRIVELFEALNRPGARSVQGLWAELLLLANASDTRAAVLAWHSSPSDTFDFEQGATRLEVKSTLSQLREHDVSLEQLDAPTGGHVAFASVLMTRSDKGSSVDDLAEIVLERVGADAQLRQRVEMIIAASLGDQWRDGSHLKFDTTSALETLRFFATSEIPRIEHSAIPAQVSRVRFRVDLSGVPALQPREILQDSLLKALHPSPA